MEKQMCNVWAIFRIELPTTTKTRQQRYYPLFFFTANLWYAVWCRLEKENFIYKYQTSYGMDIVVSKTFFFFFFTYIFTNSVGRPMQQNNHLLDFCFIRLSPYTGNDFYLPNVNIKKKMIRIITIILFGDNHAYRTPIYIPSLIFFIF